MTCSDLLPSADPAAAASRLVGRHDRLAKRVRAGARSLLVAGFVFFGFASPARATAVYALSSVCQGYSGDICTNGAPAIWTPPNGALVSTSTAQAMSDASPGNDATFSLSGTAQSSVQNVNRWTANVEAGGYINSAYYNSNQINAVAFAYVEDEFTLPSTPTWSGAGFLALQYHLTGSASVNYSYDGRSTDPRNAASASLRILCYATQSGPCTATGLTQTSTGTFTAALDGAYDNDVTFFIPVQSDVASLYQFKDYLTAGLALYGDATPSLIDGGASADFTHTVQLVGADLLDASMVPVPDWTIMSGSGFDYAHIADVTPPVNPLPAGTVPEPSTVALFGLGLLGTAVGRRRACRPAT